MKIIDKFSPSWWWGKEGIFSDPGVLCSSIFSRSSNGQGQRRPRQLDSPIVMDPLLVAGWLFIFWKEQWDRELGFEVSEKTGMFLVV